MKVMSQPTGSSPMLSKAVADAHGITAHSVSASSLLVQMVIGLVVVVVLIKVASRFLQGRGARSVGAARRQGAITVLGRQSLGKGVQVAVVTAVDQTYVLGVTQQQITVIGQRAADQASPADLQGGMSPEEGLQLIHGQHGASSGPGEGPGWRSAVEQLRAKTVRRA